jgi:hypothetical protein
MRRLLPLLAFLAAPAFAQGNCSDGTTGVIVSLEPADLTGDTLTVCFALEGNPSETLGHLMAKVYYRGMYGPLHYPDLPVPPQSPYHGGDPYWTNVIRCLASPECDDNFYVDISNDGGPYLSFSPDPVRFLCLRFVVTGPPETAGIEVRWVSAEQGDGMPASVCPPKDQGSLGTFVIVEPEAPAREVSMAAPQPNPARGVTTIPFELAAPAAVRLTVYDALGREVARLVDGPLPAGAHEAPFEAGALPAGAYLVRMETPDALAVQRLVLVR